MGAMRAIAAILAFGLVLAAPTVATGQDTESAVYAAAKDCSGLRSYLRSYPNGRFRADAQARIAKDCEAPKPVTRAAAPPPAPVDPCIRARADWPQISASNDLSVLRAFLSATSYECQVQRAQATSRINELETAQRDAAARQTAAQQAEAQRVATAAAQAQVVLNRSWSAIAVSDWGDFWGTSYVDWGGATGQSSPAAAEASAIKACDEKGDGKGCRLIRGTFNQGCLAFAYKGEDLINGPQFRESWDMSDIEASSAALKKCDVKGCKVELVICAKPG